MAFSASDAAFEGFRIVRREPVSVLVWAAVRLAITLASLVVTIPLLSAGMAAIAQTTPPTALNAFLNMLPVFAFAVPVGLVTYAVFTCAVYRAVLRPEDRGLARLKLGSDELRIFLVLLSLVLLLSGAGMAIGFVFGLTAGLAGVAASSSPAGQVLGVLLGVGAVLGAMFVFFWLAVRLSLAAPMTFVQGRVRVFSSWSLTKGRFWPLFGCYLLAMVFLMILYLAALTVFAVLGLATGSSVTEIMTGMFQPDYRSLASYFTPARLIYLPLGSLFGAVVMAVSLAPPAIAYREITGGGPQAQAQAFD